MSSKDIDKASVNTIELCPTQTIECSDLEPRDKPKLLVNNELKIETKIEMKCAVNFEYIQQPKGLFEDKEIRNGFIRKVYSILFVQILVTIIVCGVMITFFRDKLNGQSNDTSAKILVTILSIIACVTYIAILVIFCCSMSARRTVPLNYILLGILTIAMSFLTGLMCAQNDGENILIAFIITGVVVLAITLLATTPYFDITNCGCLLCILLIIHILMGIIISIIVITFQIQAKPVFLILAIAGAFLFSLYLLYHTQLILGGKKVEISPEEYIFAAICLYMDIIRIFMYILRIIGLARD